MKQIRTKKELLSNFNECLDGRHIKDDDKQKIFDEWTKKIIDFLEFADDNIELPEGLKCLEFEISFGDFVIQTSTATLKKRLETIYHDLKIWKDLFACNNRGLELAKNSCENAKACAMSREIQQKLQRESHIGFTVFIIFFIIFSALVIISSIIAAIPCFESTSLGIACAITASAASGLDVINGIAFGVREVRNDRKRKADCVSVEEAIQSGKQEDYINQCTIKFGKIINKGVVNVYNAPITVKGDFISGITSKSLYDMFHKKQ